MKQANSVFILVLSIFYASFVYAQSWEKLNKQGMSLYQAGKYTEAIAIFEKAKKQAQKEFGKEHPSLCNILQ